MSNRQSTVHTINVPRVVSVTSSEILCSMLLLPVRRDSVVLCIDLVAA